MDHKMTLSGRGWGHVTNFEISGPPYTVFPKKTSQYVIAHNFGKGSPIFIFFILRLSSNCVMN